MESLSDKILIVDDDENISEILNMYLESSGYTTKIASTGKRAQELFLEYNPNLVLLDVMIPGIDGIDVLKWVRKQGEVPVIMLTAKSEEMDKIMGLNIGADDYVTKPFNPMELIARVNSQLRRYSKYLNINGNYTKTLLK